MPVNLRSRPRRSFLGSLLVSLVILGLVVCLVPRVWGQDRGASVRRDGRAALNSAVYRRGQSLLIYFQDRSGRSTYPTWYLIDLDGRTVGWSTESYRLTLPGFVVSEHVRENTMDLALDVINPVLIIHGRHIVFTSIERNQVSVDL